MGSRMDVGIGFCEGLEGDFGRLGFRFGSAPIGARHGVSQRKKAGQRGPAFLLWIDRELGLVGCPFDRGISRGSHWVPFTSRCDGL